MPCKLLKQKNVVLFYSILPHLHYFAYLAKIKKGNKGKKERVSKQ